MNNLIQELAKARTEIITAIDKVDKNKINITFLEEWNLKDLVSHLTGWADYQMLVIEFLLKGKVPPEPGKIDTFNQKSTAKRKILPWDKVYEEFKDKSQQLINSYAKIPDNMWDTPLWPDKKTTLEKFIKIEIRHYSITHLPQIQKLL